VRVERQIAEVSATLLPGHPRMKQLNADFAGRNGQIKSEVDKIVDGLEREAKVAALPRGAW
jgi:succinoglycan biosynthesis transport protein ExoP